MSIFSKYLYFFGTLIALLVFFIIFCPRKDLQIRMIRIGLLVGVIGVLFEVFFFQDYWNPPLLFRFGKFGGIEDFLFGFATGGISTAIYAFLFRKRFHKKNSPHYWIIPTMVGIELLSFFIFFYLCRFNSIYASAIGFLISAVTIVTIRKDLITESIVSAVVTALLLVLVESLLLVFAVGYLRQYYFLYGKMLLLFGYTPITELIWGLSFGAAIGPLYDFASGTVPLSYSIRNIKNVKEANHKIKKK